MSWSEKARAIVWITLSAAMTKLGRRCDKWAHTLACRAAKVIPGAPPVPPQS